MKKVTPFLWYDGQAEEAMKLYTSLFPNSHIVNTTYWPAGSPFPQGQVMAGTFELDGQSFYCFDAGPQFRFTEAISMFVECKTQEEVDRYWNALTANGGEESQCGWLKDRFGLSWQIVPSVMMDMLRSENKEGSARAMQAMMKMKKLIIADLQAAFEGK
jgi:predicted 3-demethylubiquinone-9 3-methyltransferase (glyoxalase superfamily)